MTWILPSKVPFRMTSSCASVRFVASLLTTIQKLPLILPPKSRKLIRLSPIATIAHRPSTFTRTPAIANNAFA
jgi:hypothetical protein